MQNPFTTTFSKFPEHSYIPNEQVEEILENFSYEYPSEAVYKITGVRGSGKTVLLGKVEAQMQSSDQMWENWRVYRLSSARNMLQQMASFLYKEDFIKAKKKSVGVNISATVLGTGGGFGVSSTEDNSYFDIGVEIDAMLQEAALHKMKILIGIDEVSKTPDMEIFAMEFGKWLREGYPVYLVCTGLYENIEQLYNVKNLTFFRRATTIKTQPLNFVKMSEMYRKQLGANIEAAKQMAAATKGYAYAFQELGVLSFRNKERELTEDLVGNLKTELYGYAYEKIWEELSREDQNMVKILLEKEEYKREEVMNRMEKPGNYSVYRDRLLRRGIISSRQGYISLSLPYFADYVKEYCMA